ncbi:hypothetical protein L6164_012573 [Bauhinia variegata]|uniref:Uncharacterized protein n=1 Tax=Bauhinia variegata TaxID=167791 RepID=A0ACB9PAF4_BAUVA|nr:hypothetical protein L6164_012573 [Bauhinia variegata]
MFSSQRRKAFQYLKENLTSSANLLFSLNFSTSTAADKTSFAVTYLINNGFSPEAALQVSKRARFKTSTKPDSVLNFFRNNGFSDSQLYSLIRKGPWLLSCDPSKRILPKFEFLLSKGASSSDIVHMVSSAPNFLRRSLENHIIPRYELVKRFVQTDTATILCLRHFTNLLYISYMAPNIQLLLDNGVTEPIISRMIRSRPSMLSGMPSSDFTKSIEEVKKLRFDTCKVQFLWALKAKGAMSKSKWDAKVDAFKKWGWSEEMVLEAFKRDPLCMLASLDRIDAVMSFWVNQLGWDSLVLAERPLVFRYSFEKRIVPRASVLHFLLSEGLISKKANKIAAFDLTEMLFLQKYVQCFEEKSSQILKLYEEKLNLKHKKKNGSI